MMMFTFCLHVFLQEITGKKADYAVKWLNEPCRTRMKNNKVNKIGKESRKTR